MYSHRDPSIRKSGTGNIFIKNLDKAIDHKALHDTFSSFGSILSCKIATDASGQSKGYGFVQFENGNAAQNAIDKLNGMLINDKQVFVGHFLRKQERDSALSRTKFTNVYVKNLSESTKDDDLKNIFDDAAKAVDALNGMKFDDRVELKGKFEQTIKETVDKFQGLNLYVKNLDDSIDDEKLKELFSEFGTITSCKVMRDPSGISRDSGFVAFSTPEETSRALQEMNGKMIVSKPLYIALAQRKEERRARLQAQFSQMRPVAMAPSVAPLMPMYPPGAPGLGQQFMYGQGPPAIIPPQAGFGYQQQMLPRGRVYRYPPGRNMPDVPMPGMLPVPYDMGAGMAMRDATGGQPMPITALSTALANASPEQQRTLLGESLYPQVEQLERDAAAKVTDMLLEMDQTEVLHLLESPEALKAKVAEAMEVLRTVAAQQQANSPTDQLASLSLE
ncbi:hypothetical protein Ddye_010269 [Dipteronia dyeriana]|uniref:Polyadenylate-binding protein n=1 Tax=Dipteronia dyeriana TaxID=168575 RepID=A0AAD9XDB4_9ROSI|nr:hypothetical protein Ddye_010269 [Dipteronia dyeriana]